MFSNFIGFVYVGGDPPKSPLIRGTLTEFSPLFKGGMGGIEGFENTACGVREADSKLCKGGF
jgi:hypothetical protein